ncbi:dmX-like protein 1 isoform X2 [Scleropages formosus]|uniref:dmX-like protein 1 isoform X2 n=1 Tax=Scleropages formosus TaxID=113540 RepID=UPI0010FA9F01|nr:dmX-like protein 1 isoform X2 [Scleropages formosus]
MNLHQVLTGAVNPGDNCFAVGNINEEPFTAYASGCDIVVLGSDFERLQIIPGAKHGNIQVGCVDCSLQGGQIAASYGNVVCVFEPVPLSDPKEKTPPKLNYQWQKSGQFILDSAALNLAWDPSGTYLLTGSTSLQLWSIDRASVNSEAKESLSFEIPRSSWKCVWQCKTASPVHLIKFSPGGDFFATAGQDDCLVKVWYSTSRWQSGGATLFTPPEPFSHGEMDFSFIYLAHPRSVTGFSWRKTSKYMPRGSVCNVLLTCCKDSVCRLWAETLLPSDSVLSRPTRSYGNNAGVEAHRSAGITEKLSSNIQTQSRSTLELNLKDTWRGPERSLGQPAHTGFLPHQQDRHQAHRANMTLHANALCHFHIAASINPATDIPLLPSISSLSTADDDELGGPFTVHWLNNKELHLTLAMEVFLHQLRSTVEQQSQEQASQSDEEFRSDEDELPISPTKEKKGKGQGALMGIPLPAAAVDHQMALLLEEWNKGADMLFSIHPMDGSLLVWHVDWLDEYQPGMFRQVQVSFVSRIPVAFPTGDANSLSRSVVMYACNKNVDLAIQQGRQQGRHRPTRLPHSSSALISSGHSKNSGLRLSIFTPNVLMISKHADGSLNQWAVSFAEESAFSTVLSVSHKSRYCGHRFHLNGLACHSLLPLLLTTSHHNALRTPEVDHAQNGSFPGCPNRSSLEAVSQDPNAIYSELILWRVDPVGPLSFSGGVSELARINSLHASAFSNVAWLPILIPSHCLGVYGNSPSACFIASDGLSLRLYQAVIEAKKLLSELSNPEISKYVGEVFNIISLQSTARPGCIIALDAITDFQGKKTQLLHVFEEDLILSNETPDPSISTSGRIASGQSGFSARFFLVVMECTQSGRSLLHMWHLQLAAQQVIVDEPPVSSNRDSTNSSHFSFSPERLSTLKPVSSTSNLQTACRLQLVSHRVYSQELELPEGVEVIQVTPSAGHLSSSSLQPSSRAPYLLATSCSDHKVRFWRCRVELGDPAYVWEEWPLLVQAGLDSGSALNVPGRPLHVSCCHTGRVAVAYRRDPSTSLGLRDSSTLVSIFQCESTGGSQWLLEQTLSLEDTTPVHPDKVTNRHGVPVLHSNQEMIMQTEVSPESNTRSLVHLDWVSREDGSHILTVGNGSKLQMYGLLSGKPPELGLREGWREGSSQQNSSRLVLLRCVDLVSSVEGALPIPVSLSWVRNGILVVGMDCEMHVYSQWQPPALAKPPSVAGDVDTGSVISLIAAVRQGPEEAQTAPPPRRNLTRSMTSLAQKLSGKRTAYDLPPEMEDCGLFEAAHHLFPTLPQYHPVQLMELMDLGKVRRAKAILSHLVKCIAGEIVPLQDNSTSQERRLRSLSISASGSTARDPKLFNNTENPDYTEIDSIPPLPLYALLAADEDSSSKPKDKAPVTSMGSTARGSSEQTDTYNELFQDNSVVSELDPLDSDQEDSGPKVIDLSQYGPTFFGPEHTQVLSSHLLHSSLPGLTRMEQMSLMALADTIATTSTDIEESREKHKGGETLDECGLKFLLAVRLHTFLLTSLPPAHRARLLRQGLSTCHFAWAFHSEAEEELLNMLPALQKGEPTWPELRAMGVGWWLRSTSKLRRCIEKVAKATFQRNNDPLDAAIFYLALKKKAVVWGLYRSQKNAKMTAFFSNDFNEDRWRRAALKNAFALLGKQRFQHSAAFFLLAGSLKDAVEVCLEKMHDLQLALVISRLYESEFEASSTYKLILQRHVLGREAPTEIHQDPFLRSMAHWILEDYGLALDTLLVQPSPQSDMIPGSIAILSPGHPEVFNFYTYLRTHPLLLRRHFQSSESKSSSRVGLSAEGRLADSISLVERRLFFTAAYAHFQAGCPMLALEVLSKMPKVVRKSKLPLSQEDPVVSPGTRDSLLSADARQDRASDLDWSHPVVNGYESVSDGLSNSQSDSALSFDWSQPSLTMQDGPLELKWDSESEDEESGLAMKNIHMETAIASKDMTDSSSPAETGSGFTDADIVAPSEDILTAQLKFMACLKILTTELRTLSTGYELDGGKLRYQLCHWLEREVAALQSSCGYNADLQGVTEGIVGDSSCDGPVEEMESGTGTAGGFAELQRRRRHWLRQNQPLLRMFLSYCSLHGSHGGGLASVQMELILLLQESQQEDPPKSAAFSLLQPKSSIPLLLACTASAKTVVANPIVHLSNLTHDILHTINALDSPPHPSIINNKIYVMHTLAASLSACIYQCLCDGRSFRQANHFTGTVYQSFLLSQQHPARTVSMDEAVLPNTSPAQWPGILTLVRLLSSAGEETQPGLTVLLCEVLTAVYLSLFVHGLATHSSNELFRIVAHPLNSKLWAAVFGGGARVPIADKRSPFRLPSGDDLDRKSKRFHLRSSRSTSAESPQGPPSPVVEQETSIFKEEFVPPELSIWDYFIAKPFLPPSESRVEYDSEESQGSEGEEEEEDIFDSNALLQEHSNPNSYSWCLMRLAMVQLVLVNLKSFYPMAGHDLLDLPVCSPLCHNVLKTLQRWEQLLQKRLEIFGGPPLKYISTHPLDETPAAGPALLRHKALFEPTNTPFRSSHHSALAVRRLWQYLVKQEEVQETFIRNIFTKKRDPNESGEEHSESNKNLEEPSFNQVETDLGYPGGKARIIHKESDIITAFAINKANRNCLVIASSHDIQELDVSSILATQILTWVDDEAEAKGEDFLVIHAREDFGTLQGTTPYTHSSPGTPINMPWLGSMQTGRGASVLIKRNINNVRRMTSHPTLPYYLTGAQDGSVRMFEWGHSQQIICYRSPGNSRVTRIRFNHQGNKFGIVDADGVLSLWQTNMTGNTPKPYLTLQCHNKTAHDFVFVGSSSLIATAGLSSDNRNVCLWDTLVTPVNSLVHAFTCHESGATVLSLASRQQLLISGGRKGWICVMDLRLRSPRQSFQAHDSPIKALAVDPTEDCFISGSAEGNIKIWSLTTQGLLHTFSSEHTRQSLFRNLGTGVMQIESGPANHIFSCGADGTMKMRILPDRYGTGNSNPKNDIKFIM